MLPKAILCYSCNVSTIYDYNGTGGEANQAGLIQGAYNFTVTPSALCVNAATGDNTCAATSGAFDYTTTNLAGYDPLAIVEHPLAAQGTTSASGFALLPNAGFLLASIPTRMTCDPSDTTVGCPQNSQAYVNAANAINPAHLFVPGIGGHNGAPLYNGAAALAWFAAHP